MAVIDPAAISDTILNNAITACAAENACEAAWQASYAYAADQAYKLAIFQALQGIAFGVLQYASADRTADQQYDIANRQMVIAEEEYARYKAQYAPCEDALRAEICALELPTVDYDTRADRALRDVRIQFSNTRRQNERSRSRYCMSDQLFLECELNKAEALAVIAARDTAYRYAEAYQDTLDARRWERRVTMFGFGRDIMSGQSNTYTGSMGAASDALSARQGAYDNLLSTISGSLGAVGNAYSARADAYRSFSNANLRTNQGQSMIAGGGVPTPSSISRGVHSGVSAYGR